MRAAIYARSAVSDPESVNNQVSTCLARASRMGFLVNPLDIFVDCGVSGMDADQMRGLQAFLRRAEERSPQLDCVMVVELSRFGRNIPSVVEVCDRLDRAAITIFICSGGKQS